MKINCPIKFVNPKMYNTNLCCDIIKNTLHNYVDLNVHNNLLNLLCKCDDSINSIIKIYIMYRISTILQFMIL